MQVLKQALRGMQHNWWQPAISLGMLSLSFALLLGGAMVASPWLARFRSVPEPSQLLQLCSGDGNTCGSVTQRDIYMVSQAGVFGSVSGSVSQDVGVDIGGQIRRLRAEVAMPDFFQTLGILPRLGRFPEGNASDGIVISSELWSSVFGSDDGVIGRNVKLLGRTVTVLGVAPSGFRGLRLAGIRAYDIWIPLGLAQELRFPNATPRGGVVLLGGVARSSSTVNPAALSALNARLEALVNSAQPDETPSRRRLFARSVNWFDYLVGVQEWKDSITRGLLIFGGVVFVTLFTAMLCSSALLLARAEERAGNIAICVALGASRWRVAMPLVAEGMVTALAALPLGWGLAQLGLFFLNQQSAYTLPGGMQVQFVPELHFDAVSSAFAVIFALAVIITGLPVLWGLRQTRASDILSLGNPRVAGRPVAARLALTSAIVIAATIHLVLAVALTIATYTRLAVPKGLYGSNWIVTTFVPTNGAPWPSESSVLIYDALSRLSTELTGVAGVSLANQIAPASWVDRAVVRIENRKEPLAVERRRISHDFHETAGLQLLEGRFFTSQDDPRSVSVVTRTLAARWWPEESAIGQQFQMADGSMGASVRTVIGVIADVLDRDIVPTPIAFVPLEPGALTLHAVAIIRPTDAGINTARLSAELREYLARTAPQVMLSEVEPWSSVLARSSAWHRLSALVSGSLAVLTLTMAGISIAALVSSMAVARQREIGVRTALGANALRSMIPIVRMTVAPLTVAVGTGAFLGWMASRYVALSVFGDTSLVAGPLAVSISVFCGMSIVALSSIPSIVWLSNQPLTRLLR